MSLKLFFKFIKSYLLYSFNHGFLIFNLNYPKNGPIILVSLIVINLERLNYFKYECFWRSEQIINSLKNDA